MPDQVAHGFTQGIDRGAVQYHPAGDYQLRHRDFHQRKAVKRPLIGFYNQSIYPMAAFIASFPEGEITPEDLHPDSYLPVYEEVWVDTGLMWGELIHWASPLNGFPWMEAICGCPVHASVESKSVWAEEPPGFQIGDEIQIKPANPWFDQLIEVTKALVHLSAGRYPVAPGIMRGISDLMVALLGHNHFYIHLKDRPEDLRALASQLADLWIEVVKAQYQVIPAFDGGYANAGLWLPGCCPVYQEDAAALISPADFERVIAPSARRVLEAFEYPIMHLHSEGLHLVPILLGGNQNITIEVNIDPAGPPLEHLLPVFADIQKAAPLEVFGKEDEVLTCLEALPAAGTAYLIMESELEEPDG
jgi:hypothetical protein